MSKKHDQEYGQALFESLQQIAAGNRQYPATPPALVPHPLTLFPPTPRELRKMKKFRFQLLHRWLVERFEPCRAADIGGGKGLLAYLLQESGWETAVIDPTPQSLPDKFKNITTGQRIRTPADARVRHINREFDGAMAHEFDLLIGMHAHGCNAQIIDAAAESGSGFILFPCCVINEPFYPRVGTTWLESVADYAVRQGHHIFPFRLNFKGQNVGLAAPGRRCILKS